ncbi:33037_t:CDS:2 [Gigaspora margarita]|uniref:33037_t:CDS:1 n=1 Tax=Gigaspora margarita TaxID=4874 RepID=A0ABN7V3Z1_GIGMA|nr:33037_t:CDS:2 [Gigaspora margarita]
MPMRKFSNVGTPKIHVDYDEENYLDDDNNDTMPLDDELELSVAFESNEALTDSPEEQSSTLA